MFEAAEIGRQVNAEDYASQEKTLRLALLDAQFAAQRANVPVVVIIEGIDNVAKGDVANMLYEWLDARGLAVSAFGEKSDEERERPWLWRYWRALPQRGQIAVFAGAWYGEVLAECAVVGKTAGKTADKKYQFERRLKQAASLERMLTLDGALVLKFWLHLSKKALRKRLQDAEYATASHSIGPVSDHTLIEHYSRLIKNSERMLRHTELWQSSWNIVEAEDVQYRNLAIGRTILAALQKRLTTPTSTEPPRIADEKLPRRPEGEQVKRSILDTVDLSCKMDTGTYEKALAKYQRNLLELSWEAYRRQISAVIVFEGWDAAGKGSAIRRLLHGLDARLVRVIQVAAPTDEELARHYLWRFWRHLPRAGHMTVYDRSWYGRVLVERVEGLATESEWQRAYGEINDFEEQLADHRMVLAKFWLHIDPDEQLKRFQAREATPHKRHKITSDDYRNRARWKDYELAVNEMVAHTSTAYSPWHIISANNKKYARIQVLKLVCQSLKKALKR